MGETNQSSNSEFLLLGLSRQPQRQKLLFVLFLSRYLATVLGNLLILLAISPDSHLHIPMSFFLCSLSFVDVCFSSTTVPKMLANHILRNNAIPPFSCDVTPLLKLSCSDTHLNEVMILTEGALIMSTPFVCIVVSYIHITCAVLRVPSTKGRWKAFSTCGSHLAVVSFFYGTIIAVYFNPLSSHSSEKDTTATVMYTVVTPMLNPFIYSVIPNYGT
eukprot:bmy_02757T0